MRLFKVHQTIFAILAMDVDEVPAAGRAQRTKRALLFRFLGCFYRQRPLIKEEMKWHTIDAKDKEIQLRGTPGTVQLALFGKGLVNLGFTESRSPTTKPTLFDLTIEQVGAVGTGSVGHERSYAGHPVAAYSLFEEPRLAEPLNIDSAPAPAPARCACPASPPLRAWWQPRCGRRPSRLRGRGQGSSRPRP